MENLGETIEGVKQVVAEAKRACSKALIPLPEEVSPCKGGAAHLRSIGRGGVSDIKESQALCYPREIERVEWKGVRGRYKSLGGGLSMSPLNHILSCMDKIYTHRVHTTRNAREKDNNGREKPRARTGISSTGTSLQAVIMSECGNIRQPGM